MYCARMLKRRVAGEEGRRGEMEYMLHMQRI